MFESCSRRLFFFALFFAPLAFGTVEPWSYAVMEIAATAAFFLYFIHAAKTRNPLYETPGIRWLILLLAFVILQIVPLPASLVELISPAAFKIQQPAAFARGTDAWMTLSVHPRATVRAFFRICAYAAFFVLTVQWLTRKNLLKKTVLLVTIFAAVLSFSSILQLYLAGDTALWVRHVPHAQMMVGPYVNRNHYAGFMEMLLPVVLALFFFYRPRLGSGSLIRDLLEIFSGHKGNIHILIGAAVLLISASIFLSLSRGAIISTCLAFLMFAFLLSKRLRTKQGTIPLAVLALLICLSVSWFGWEPIVERFGRLKSEYGDLQAGRIGYWQDTWDLIRDFPIVGAGFGTFVDIYPPYRSMGKARVLDHAHNDYLEVTAEGGIVGFVLFFGFVATVLLKTFRAYARRRDPYSIYISIGSITGVIALLFHSFSDFNLQIGANGLWFFFLLALAVSAAHTRIHLSGDATRLKARPFFGGVRSVGLAASGILLAMVVLFNFSAVTGDFYYRHVHPHDLHADMPAADLEKIEKIAAMAAAFDPLNAKYDFARADVAWFQNARQRAETGFVRAIAKNPTQALYFKRYGLFLIQGGQREEAARMLERSVRLDPFDWSNAFEYGALLVSMEREDEGLALLKQAVALRASAMDAVLTTLSVRGFSAEQAAGVVPDLPGAVIRYAAFLSELGKREAAAENYLRAMALMEQGVAFERRDIYRVYQFFMKQDLTLDAMDVLRRAETLLPNDADIRIRLGDLYQREGIYYKAQEKYESALLIDPGNPKARQRLNR